MTYWTVIGKNDFIYKRESYFNRNKPAYRTKINLQNAAGY